MYRYTKSDKEAYYGCHSRKNAQRSDSKDKLDRDKCTAIVIFYTVGTRELVNGVILGSRLPRCT